MQKLSWSLSWFFYGLGYSKDSHNVSGSHSLPQLPAAMHRYVASAAVSSRCLKPTERILEVRFVTGWPVVWKSWGNHVEIPWDESAEIQLKVVCLATWGWIFSFVSKISGLGFWSWRGFSSDGKRRDNSIRNRGWRVAKGIITDRSRGISFQSATFWMGIGSCHWIWAHDRKRVRRWGRAMAVAADWFSLMDFHYGIALGHDIRVLDEDVGWFLLV